MNYSTLLASLVFAALIIHAHAGIDITNRFENFNPVAIRNSAETSCIKDDDTTCLAANGFYYFDCVEVGNATRVKGNEFPGCVLHWQDWVIVLFFCGIALILIAAVSSWIRCACK